MMIDLDDLERKARAASPGPWWRCTCCSMLYRHDGETDGARYYIAEARRSGADADYIAVMNPAVALKLIERVRRAEARASAWKRLAKRLRARVRTVQRAGNTRALSLADAVIALASALDEAKARIAELDEKMATPRPWPAPRRRVT